MSLPMRPTLLPQCTSCLRRISNLGLQEWPSGQQVRGKKKLANTSNTVTVRLMKDVATFGRKGSYVPISMGQMRNVWFPMKTAAYVTDVQLKDLKAKNISAVRDFQFGVSDPVAVKAANTLSQRLPTRTVEVEKLPPKRSLELLSMLLPPVMNFRRRAQEAPAPAPAPAPVPATPTPTRKDRAFSSAADDLLAAAQSAPVYPTTASSSSAVPIFGTVSSADVVSRITYLLSEDQEASRIVLAADDVRFVSLSSDHADALDTDKIRHLGEFQVEVRVKGGESPVKRLVCVLPVEADGDNVSYDS